MSPDAFDPSRESALLDFLTAFTEDRLLGRELPLENYLARWPGHEDAIRDEHARILAAVSRSTPTSGRRVLDRYRIVERIGRGGQGSVWLAHDERLDRAVAIKSLPFSETAFQRLRREAEIGARLDAEGLGTVLDVAEEDGELHLVMRWIEGRSLNESLAERSAPPPPGSEAWKDLLRLAERLALALGRAHAAGLVHRDVKAENVIVTPAGDPVLIDFGIAFDADLERLTHPGHRLGTPGAMAPEQHEGDAVDARTDLWALGALLHRLLHDATPDAAGRAQPRDQAIVLATALARDPDARYATASAFAEDLRRLRSGEPVRAAPPSAWRAFASWLRRNPAVASLLCAAALVLILGQSFAAGAFHRARKARSEAKQTLEAVAASHAEEGRILDAVRRLADLELLRELRTRKRGLWPALPRHLEGLEAWLSDADSVLRRIPAHRSLLASLRNAPKGGPADEFRGWWINTLEELLEAATELERSLPHLRERQRIASEIEKRSLVDARSAWTAAARHLASDPRFAGVELKPQLGLLPLGPDPKSGLLEFAHLLSGEAPKRAPDGALEIEAHHGIVLVLIPGGRFFMGSEKGREFAFITEHPRHELSLAPYFIGKYELTRAQVARALEEKPPEGNGLLPRAELNWFEACSVLSRWHLLLPTEARWERACRAGTTTPWSSGKERETLAGRANLSGQETRGILDHEDFGLEAFDDGHIVAAPIGSFMPNPYGLHDMHGNLVEWCLDALLPYTISPRPGDGYREGEDRQQRCFRGGSYQMQAAYARSAARGAIRGVSRMPGLGARAARSLER